MRLWWSRLPRDSRVAAALALLVIVQTVALAAFGWAAARSRRAQAERDLRSFAELQLLGGVVEPVRRALASVEAEALDAVERGAAEAVTAPVAPDLFDPAWALAPDGTVTGEGEVVRVPVRHFAAADVPAAVRERIAELEAAAVGGRAADRVRDLLALAHGETPEAGRVTALRAAARAALQAGEDTLALRAAGELVDGWSDAVLDDEYPLGPGAETVRFEVRLRRLRAGAPDAAAAFARAAVALRRALLGAELEPASRRSEVAAFAAAAALAREHLPPDTRDALATDLARLEAVAAAATPLRDPVRCTALRSAARVGLAAWWPDTDAPGDASVAWCVTRAVDGTVVARRTTADRLRTGLVVPVARLLALREGTRLRLLGPDRAAVDDAGPSPAPGAALTSHVLALPTGTLLGEVVLEDPGLLDAEAARSRRLVIGLFAAAALSLGLGAVLVLRMVRAEVRFARMKASFVSSVSHELKTPLTSIRMFLETLREGRARTEEERTECLDILDRETERLDRLVHRVLEFSGTEGTAARLRPESIDPAEVSHEAARVFRGRLQPDGCDFRVETSNDLPAAPLDRDAMVAVLLNLLENAWKYTPPTGKRIALRVAPAPGGRVRWEVEDNGPGVPPDERKRVFEEFWRSGRPETQATGGTGLGLALARRLVEAHGGRIDVEDGAAGGSRFIVEIPGER